MEKKRSGVKTPMEVREDLLRKGFSISRWAKEHGVNRALVHAVLNGTRGTRFGQGHKVAVLLGLKHGEISDAVRRHEPKIERSGGQRAA